MEAHFCYIHFYIPTFEEVWDKYITLSRSRYKGEPQSTTTEEIEELIGGNPILYQCIMAIVIDRSWNTEDDGIYRPVTRELMMDTARENYNEIVESFKDDVAEFIGNIVDNLVGYNKKRLTPELLLNKPVKWTMED